MQSSSICKSIVKVFFILHWSLIVINALLNNKKMLQVYEKFSFNLNEITIDLYFGA